MATTKRLARRAAARALAARQGTSRIDVDVFACAFSVFGRALTVYLLRDALQDAKVDARLVARAERLAIALEPR